MFEYQAQPALTSLPKWLQTTSAQLQFPIHYSPTLPQVRFYVSPSIIKTRLISNNRFSNIFKMTIELLPNNMKAKVFCK